MTKPLRMIASIMLFAVICVQPATAQALDDETIFAIFDQANMADIATGRLGWKKGESEDVRTLAKMVVTDHLQVQQMGRELAEEMNMLGTPPANDASWAAQAEALAMLDKLSGRAFDEAYLRHEIAYHTGVIAAINDIILPAVQDSRFKTLIETVLPGFEGHLEMTRKTADKLNVAYE